MDYQASQQISQILRDLEPEDAIQILTSNLQNYENVTVRVIDRDDVISHIDEYHDGHSLTEEDVAAIMDAVVTSDAWQGRLTEPTEDDWDILNGEIQFAADTLGLSLD